MKMMQNQPADVKAIEDIEQRLANAWVDRDQAAIDKILAAEWSVIDGSARVLTKSASLVLRFTDVFVRREGQWQAVASHGSMVVP